MYYQVPDANVYLTDERIFVKLMPMETTVVGIDGLPYEEINGIYNAIMTGEGLSSELEHLAATGAIKDFGLLKNGLIEYQLRLTRDILAFIEDDQMLNTVFQIWSYCTSSGEDFAASLVSWRGLDINDRRNVNEYKKFVKFLSELYHKAQSHASLDADSVMGIAFNVCFENLQLSSFVASLRSASCEIFKHIARRRHDIESARKHGYAANLLGDAAKGKFQCGQREMTMVVNSGLEASWLNCESDESYVVHDLSSEICLS